jgi:large subunit ribosomal protein L19e
MKLQKRLAGSVEGVGKRRVRIHLDKLEEIGGSVDDFRQSITKNDIRGYIHSGVIVIRQKRGSSRGRARKLHRQKVKGRRRGMGSRKGRATARLPSKLHWIRRIRLQRRYLFELRRDRKISAETFRQLYLLAKGGFFRSKRHIHLYLEERGLMANA